VDVDLLVADTLPTLVTDTAPPAVLLSPEFLLAKFTMRLMFRSTELSAMLSLRRPMCWPLPLPWPWPWPEVSMSTPLTNLNRMSFPRACGRNISNVCPTSSRGLNGASLKWKTPESSLS
jgi:hypothetical protein